MVIEDARTFIKAAGVPGIEECEAMKVEMMAELVAKGAEKSAERGDVLANGGAHPDPDQHDVRVIVAEKLGRRVFANAKGPGGEDTNVATRNLVEIRSSVDKELAGAGDVSHGSGLHGGFDRGSGGWQTCVRRQRHGIQTIAFHEELEVFLTRRRFRKHAKLFCTRLDLGFKADQDAKFGGLDAAMNVPCGLTVLSTLPYGCFSAGKPIVGYWSDTEKATSERRLTEATRNGPDRFSG